MSSLAEAATNLAKAYEWAAYKLLDDFDFSNTKKTKSGMVHLATLGPIVGAVVLTSLSIEVALKALLLKHHGKALRTHDHVKLFNALPTDVRRNLEQRYARIAKTRNKSSGGNQTVEIAEVFAATKDVFTSWRYAYEPTELARNIDISTAACASRVISDEAGAI
ncbi:HEPN domain-containing protein [Xanthomonas sp. CFBP 8703]|uniref:HEPN domain-containing protein n=1 Tax=Xanthomonas bonasiae TaxID=2810351 RepID=A0ABS3B823_9XANT|nr:HEPN domain-containing protein [Xanthomonas bonasiae]MBN6103546.1 HEPN domain-containing protein [Xanthomonas bonasiae]